MCATDNKPLRLLLVVASCRIIGFIISFGRTPSGRNRRMPQPFQSLFWKCIRKIDPLDFQCLTIQCLTKQRIVFLKE